MKVLKSVGAVVAGFLAVTVLSLGTDVAVYAAWGVKAFSQPMTDALFLLAVAYRGAYGVLGGWVAARLAPGAPVAHAVWLGSLALVLSALGAVATWNEPGIGPRWYSVAVAASALPCAWLGGRLHRPGRA